MSASRTPHYITKLKRTKIPPLHVCLDSEARIAKVGERFEHRFACAATLNVTVDAFGAERNTYPIWHGDTGTLWSNIAQDAEHNGPMVVWAQNLPYDLRVTNGLRHLLDAGWKLESISLARTASWASWRKGKDKLLLTDAFSWFHCPLGRLAELQGTPRGEFDYIGATDEELCDRCCGDVEVLATAVASILGFLIEEDLGPLRPTGSGQSHAAWRKRFMPEKSMCVHDSQSALLAERAAMHTGRTEAWRLGEIKQTLYELDLSLAYCRIAAHNPLPVALTGTLARLPHAEFPKLAGDYAILAEVEVETELPLVPVTRDDGVLWPVGKFTTTLWEPEIQLLIRKGAVVRIGRCWLYRRGDALQRMSEWTIKQLEHPESHIEPAQRRMLKHWARTLVGRMALRYQQWEPFGIHPYDRLRISYELTGESGEPIKHMQLGHEMLELAALAESKSSCPMVPGWVQSRCRVILWELIEQAEPGNVYYMDTDGLLVNAKGRANLRGSTRLARDWRLEYKAPRRNVTINGPRNIEFDSEHRLSGVPRGAVRIDEITWEGELWTGLEAALEGGHADHVRVEPAMWRVEPEQKRRRPLPGGKTEPYRLEEEP